MTVTATRMSDALRSTTEAVKGSGHDWYSSQPHPDVSI
jgi:hypothetical protein